MLSTRTRSGVESNVESCKRTAPPLPRLLPSLVLKARTRSALRQRSWERARDLALSLTASTAPSSPRPPIPPSSLLRRAYWKMSHKRSVFTKNTFRDRGGGGGGGKASVVIIFIYVLK